MKKEQTNNPKHKLLEELFKDYDKSQSYPCEIVDKGGLLIKNSSK